MAYHAAPQNHNLSRHEAWDALCLIGIETDASTPERVTRILLRTPTKDDAFLTPLMSHVRGNGEIEFDRTMNGWWMQREVLDRIPDIYRRSRPALNRAQHVVQNGVRALETYGFDG